jgi:hypothetical protein
VKAEDIYNIARHLSKEEMQKLSMLLKDEMSENPKKNAGNKHEITYYLIKAIFSKKVCK